MPLFSWLTHIDDVNEIFRIRKYFAWMKTKMPPIATDVKKCKQTKIAWELSVNYWFDAFTNIYIRPIWHMRCDVFVIARTLIFGRFDWELPNSWMNKKILINSSKYFSAKLLVSVKRFCTVHGIYVWCRLLSLNLSSKLDFHRMF